MSWLALKAWVTEESRTRVPFLTVPAFGVPTMKDCP